MTDGSRITNIDALRGFALFGILLVNILAFSSAYYGTGIQPTGGRTTLETLLAFGISAIFELKFYLLFSFLFGYSVTLQLQSAEKAGAAFLPRMLAHKHQHPGIALIPLDEPHTDWHIALAWRASAHLPPAARAWLELAKESQLSTGHPD